MSAEPQPEARMSAVSPPVSRSAAAATVFETRHFQRAVSARIVRAEEWQALSEIDALLARVNALYDAAGAEVQAARVQGYADGFAVGKPDPDTGQGRRGTSGPRSSVEAGRELYRDLHSKK